ncbi:hypothetical protein [Roseateles sp. L2-2]|uniref:hypothetical protein n=1 Tax=Roseateles TaxID=93681 RepID=UPI003D35D62B
MDNFSCRYDVPASTTSIRGSVDEYARTMADMTDRIRAAKARTLIPGPTVTAYEFQRGPGFAAAREALYDNLLLLTDLLMLLAEGRDKVIRVSDAIGAMARSLSTHGGPLMQEEFELYREGQVDLLALCKALHQDPRQDTAVAACNELGLAFDGTGVLSVGAAGAIAGAWTAAQAETRAATVRVTPESRLKEEVRRLLALAGQHRLDAELAAVALYDRFLCAEPTRGQHDPVGNMHCFGLDALSRLLDRAQCPGVDAAEARKALKELLLGLNRGKDAASVILTILHGRLLPATRGTPTCDEAHRIRGAVVDEAVREGGAGLLENLAPEAREERLRMQAMAVKDLLGIDYIAAGDEGPEDAGLFDTSAVHLKTLLQACDRAVARAHIPYIAA